MRVLLEPVITENHIRRYPELRLVCVENSPPDEHVVTVVETSTEPPRDFRSRAFVSG